MADGIQKNAGKLGVKGAFTSAGFDSSSDWRFKTHLANIPLAYELEGVDMTPRPATIEGKYLSQYKDIFDLYLNDLTTDRK